MILTGQLTAPFGTSLIAPTRFSGAQHGHDVCERQRRELAREEVANLERGLVLAEEQVELGVNPVGSDGPALPRPRPAGSSLPWQPRRRPARPVRPSQRQPHRRLRHARHLPRHRHLAHLRRPPTCSTTRFAASRSSAVITGSVAGAPRCAGLQLIGRLHFVEERGRAFVDERRERRRLLLARLDVRPQHARRRDDALLDFGLMLNRDARFLVARHERSPRPSHRPCSPGPWCATRPSARARGRGCR